MFRKPLLEEAGPRRTVLKPGRGDGAPKAACRALAELVHRKPARCGRVGVAGGAKAESSGVVPGLNRLNHTEPARRVGVVPVLSLPEWCRSRAGGRRLPKLFAVASVFRGCRRNAARQGASAVVAKLAVGLRAGTEQGWCAEAASLRELVWDCTSSGVSGVGMSRSTQPRMSILPSQVTGVGVRRGRESLEAVVGLHAEAMRPCSSSEIFGAGWVVAAGFRKLEQTCMPEPTSCRSRIVLSGVPCRSPASSVTPCPVKSE